MTINTSKGIQCYLFMILSILCFSCTPCEVEHIEIASIILNIEKIELTEGDTAVLTATVNPSNATNKNVLWSSTNQDVATVDNSGMVSALKAGTTTITITTEDGGKTASCNVTVRKPSHGVDIGDWEEDGNDDGGIAS